MMTLLHQWLILGLLGLIILPCLLVADSKAETVAVSIRGDSVMIKMDLVLEENITALPLVNVQIGPSNSTLSQLIQNAIQKSVPGASLSSVEMSAQTSNSSGLWKLSERYAMIVSGASTDTGSRISIDLGFITMNVTSPIVAEDLETNLVGSATILPALQAKGAQYSNLKYYIDGSNTRTSTIPELTTQNFSLLDFAWVLPLSSMTSSQSIIGGYTNWAFDPSSPVYNLTIGVPSPEGGLFQKWTAFYNPSINVTVPAAAWATGSVVYFDIPSSTETVMPMIIGASLFTAVGTYLVDRRLTRPLRARKKR